MKNDCVRSSLIERQSFPQSKIDADPKKPFMACAQQFAGRTAPVVEARRVVDPRPSSHFPLQLLASTNAHRGYPKGRSATMRNDTLYDMCFLEPKNYGHKNQTQRKGHHTVPRRNAGCLRSRTQCTSHVSHSMENAPTTSVNSVALYVLNRTTIFRTFVV